MDNVDIYLYIYKLSSFRRRHEEFTYERQTNPDLAQHVGLKNGAQQFNVSA